MPAVLTHTNRFIYLEDDEIGIITADGHTILNKHNIEISKKIEKSHGLPSAEALHLACALELKKEIGDEVYLVSGNDELIIAADQEGLGTLAPQDRPVRELKVILKGEDEQIHFYIPC